MNFCINCVEITGFPSPAFDLGYNILLSRNNLFKEDGFKIIKYFD